MNDRKIVSAIVGERKIWESVKEHLDPNEFSGTVNHIIKLVGEYYAADPKAAHVDVEILAERYKRQEQSEKLAHLVIDVLQGLPDVSGINISKEILDRKRHNSGLKLASALSKGLSGQDLEPLLRHYVQLADGGEGEPDDEEIPQEFLVEDLVKKSFDRDSLIKLSPLSLTERLDGGVRPGHHILVFAPTEMGKTLVVINMVAGFTRQNLRTLYIGNEDPVADLQMRYITNIVGRPKSDILAYPSKAQTILDKRNYRNVIFAPLAPGTFSKIRQLVGKFKPDVVVLDQLRNLDVSSENRTQALEKAATEARNLAKSMGLLVVSVTQAADSASGKRVLNRGDVDSSNIGIPGQMDLMIGIGADEEMEKYGMRMLSFPKNKISGSHEPLEIQIDPQTSRVIEAANVDVYDRRDEQTRFQEGTRAGNARAA